ADQLCAAVVFNLPLETEFHYLVPDALRGKLGPGQRVRVPFGRGNQPQTAFCVGLCRPDEIPRGATTADDGNVGEPRRELKWIASIVDEAPLLSPQMLELTRWIADRYLCAWGQVLETVIPAGVKNQAGTRMVTLLQINPQARAERAKLKLTEKQAAILDHLCTCADPIPIEELAKAAKCGIGPINGLRKKGLIDTVRQRAGQFKLSGIEEPSQSDLKLNPDQRQALDKILEVVRSGEHRTLLLHGVTGSGKTEVYIQAIREVVSYGRQVIVLVPEISLTPQTISRFQQRFNSVAVLHSHLADAERHWHWQQIAAGRVQVVVGARSAIFAPTPHLGLIVIDEEHETSFKQDTTPRYHTREVARKRAEMERIPLILGSATPTLESWQRAQSGEDVLVSLPRRVAGLPLPPVVVVDIRHDPECAAGAAIGRALRTAMQLTLDEGGQVILFLNLRGYCPVLWCRACGAGVKCPHCDVTLTWHKDVGQAICHACDFRTPPPANCPHCGHAGIRYLGTGTQRLEQEVRAKFPKYLCVRMDSDAMRKPGSHHRALERFRKGEVRILLGTQMIAKGLDFPNVTLVGVINADTVLHQPDLRAAERTFHLIAQVAGRTGRSSRGGRVLVQSSTPTEQAILLAAQHDFPAFAKQELVHRRDTQTPPYSHLTRVILRGEDEAAVREEALKMADLLRLTAETLGSEVRILGPAPAPIAKLNKLFRYHFQFSAPSIGEIQELWRAASAQLTRSKDVEYVIDVDPMNMR
ncbi:MAG TPA: primosomal protein N', partial [Planctomycetaceae bacterium]|nr:primosomal protein N' [Planctomycetaceae bacterium]